MNKYCENCGALLNEYGQCEYCNFQEPSTAVSFDNFQNVQYEQPLQEIQCKEANIGFWTTVFPLIFAVGFGYFGLVMPIFIYFNGGNSEVPYLFFIPFALVGIGATVVFLYNIYKAIVVALFSKEIDGVVKGYRNDNVLYNGMPGQIAEIEVSTYDGKKLLLYQVGGPSRPFTVGKSVKVKVFKDYFKAIEEKEQIWKNI